ncbi:uncharacterized mitochondrial protein AtMg00810-like [Solanum stenotomum]|uniref:uncharacterized mitochondrial protein AtMg00810-like n=1 Tax=Solanum stenotomum TaxID=172797 RepID=UPI0020D027AC|nr:uncharacterized mitochondrial protein AtMg00810-like [Solanum stenotomum]
MAYLLLYVDDAILTTSSDKLRQSIISLLSSEFAMKDLGYLSYFLGIAVTRHEASPTPVDTKLKLGTTTSKPFEDPSLYRSLAGAL